MNRWNGMYINPIFYACIGAIAWAIIALAIWLITKYT